MDNRPRVVSEIIQSVDRNQNIKHLIVKFNHPHINGTPEHFNKTSATLLGYHFAKYERNGDMPVYLFENVYNTQVLVSTNTSTCSLVLCQKSADFLELATIVNVPDGDNDVTLPQVTSAKIILRIATSTSSSDDHMRKSQERYIYDCVEHVRETPVLKSSDYVFIGNAPLRSASVRNDEAVSEQP